MQDKILATFKIPHGDLLKSIWGENERLYPYKLNLSELI